MPSPQTDSVPTNLFQNTTRCLGYGFNNTKTNLCGKAMFASNDAINLLNSRPVQPSSKLLNNLFNGNSTTIITNNRPM